jgi:hypothetical protein
VANLAGHEGRHKNTTIVELKHTPKDDSSPPMGKENAHRRKSNPTVEPVNCGTQQLLNCEWWRPGHAEA